MVELRGFKAHYGHCRIPPSWSGNPSLAKWASAVRSNPERLSDDQIRALLQMGFNFAHLDRAWLMHYFELLELTQRYGSCPQRLKDTAHRQLDDWVRNMRARKRKQVLPRWRVKRLSQLGFEWILKDYAWEKRFAVLKQFQAQFGHCIIFPCDRLERLRLARWVSKQRDRLKRGLLSSFRRQRLEEIGFWSVSGRFALRLQELEAFWRRYGHLNISRRTHPHLYIVAHTVRHHPLTPQQRQYLDRMGFPWTPRQLAWNRRFEELKDYQRKHKTCRVTNKPPNTSLGEWVHHLRTRPQYLSKEHRRRLDSIGFEW